MLWFFLLFSTSCWGMAEIFYKKGNTPHEPYSHLKTTVLVGFFFGIYSTVVLFVTDVDIRYLPENFIRYFPVALCYILSMTFSYYGVRYIEESISDPIENTSCAFVPIMCAVFMHEKQSTATVVAIIAVVVGILGVGFFDRKGTADRKRALGKKLALISISMPFCYMILDAIGTFLDIYYTDDVSNTLLVHVNENNLEHTANCCYEFTFLLFAVEILLYLKARGVKFFDVGEDPEGTKNEKTTLFRKLYRHRNKTIAAVFETGGQATYLFALSEGTGVAAVILGAGTVIISFVLSRFLLKEKLSALQYLFIGIIFAGIIGLSLYGG
ncbi:MAG: EamA family transporter [Clostridia bacterium]|nr:EamA family transporter [Clostridia bacterium]